MNKKNIFLMLLVSLIFVFCSNQSDKDLYENAQNLITEKKYDEAVVIFEKLIETNKQSDLASSALFECAKIYQGQVLKNMNGNESLKKSVKVYKNVYEEYPNSEDAENALFMAGFILANDLNDLEGAKKIYQLYLEKYPNGQLADDAKVELKNLGKTPEEILKDKIQEDFANEKTS